MLDFKRLRISPTYPPYPPYHTGKYLEEYFYDYYKENKTEFDATGYTLIPIFWTNLYIAGFPNDIIQDYVKSLPPGKYFTVCQFDDGIHETLPEGTVNFVAGGRKKGIPIPLICSPIPESLKQSEVKKDIFCSFVGTVLDSEHYKCRLKLYEHFSNDKDFYLTPQRTWDRVITDNQLNEFINITQRSQFTLCPRGYGYQSFRLYEALQLNSIPVFVYNKFFFPFDMFVECDWNSFCVLINEIQIPDLKKILQKITPEQQDKMLKKGKDIYLKYFTMESMCYNILRTLKHYEKNSIHNTKI